MDKTLNLQIHEFYEGLVQYINSSDIPLSSKRSALKEAFDTVSQLNAIQIQREKMELANQKNQVEQKNTK